MAALLKHALFALAGSAFASAALAEPVPSAPEAIASAAADCWEAASSPGLNEPQLRSRGWIEGTMRSADGQPIAKAPRFYGKAKSAVTLMVMDTPGAKGCVVLSAVAKPDDIGATAQLLMQKLKALDPAVKGGRKDQSIIYISVPRVAELTPTGTKEKPGTRIVVANTAPEKK